MKRPLLCLFALLLVAFSAPAFAMDITLMGTGTGAAESLAQNLVGTGITISDVNYTGKSWASGYFSGGNAAGIGIESGIVLTSGGANYLTATSNVYDDRSYGNDEPGDADLDALIPGYYTEDAAVLEFDFVSSGDAAYFRYVFGSEEYNEYTGSAFNDVFGFFVDGVNVALIPGTSIPVAINTVNSGSPGDYGVIENMLTGYSAYYNDNDPSNGTPTPYAFEYDGFTDVFTASILGLTAGETYHIKLAIADAGDNILDSGVFLEAGSFSDTNPEPVPEPATVLLLGSGLVGIAGLRRKFRKG